MKNTHTWLLAFVAFFLMVGTAPVYSQIEQHTFVEKGITTNPRVAVISFEGDPAMRQKLEETLYRCGWFTMTSRAETAEVKIQARSLARGKFEAYVEGLGHAFSTKADVPSDPNLAVFQTVDEILKRLFKVRGLCTSKIYFVKTGNQNMKEIFACYLDGSGQERVTFNNAISTEPGWGHGNAMVYTLAAHNALSIVLVDMKNRRQRVVSSARGLNASPSLYYDGTWLALPMSIGNQVDLYVINLKGGKTFRITNDRNVESSPAWAPDGRSLCYVSDKYGVPFIFLKELAPNGREIRLTKGSGECVSPDWSPVSNMLCYSKRQSNGQRVLAVINMADSKYESKIITHASGNWEDPSWAPDGRHVVCIHSTAGGKSKDLVVVDTWSGEFVPISKGAKLALPAWRPANPAE